MGIIRIGNLSVSGNNLVIQNGKVYIDGKLVEGAEDHAENKILEVRIVEGTVESLTADGNVVALGVHGSVSAGGNVKTDSVGGSVNAGGNVNCGRIGGSVNAGGNVRHA